MISIGPPVEPPASTRMALLGHSAAWLAGTAATYRIAVRVAGATLDNKQYLAYDVTLPASDSTTLTLGVTLGAADVVTVYASSANVAFSVFGSEIA